MTAPRTVEARKALTKTQLDDFTNPYGYSEMEWAAQLDPCAEKGKLS